MLHFVQLQLTLSVYISRNPLTRTKLCHVTFACCIVPASIDSTDLDLNPKVIRGKSITLHCPVEGSPFPNITWFKDDEVLDQNEAEGRENEAGGRVTVRMSGRQLDLSLAQRSDAAKYSCVAVNVAGKDALHFYLQVLGESSHIISFISSSARYSHTEPWSVQLLLLLLLTLM